ncbi:TonB-dependent receptor [Dyadobacter sp. CY107]|uniref:SusC/RagA family TonB-linked outer membrane protein n=1 Tax=Dyadobacter fanqingshengii TaxID=2906443 RepID=UPI001F1DBF0D|nr:TonB-dependent receptor [Dyadobacter fanqingshengii]MCF2502110.1 TonB-dependent receptor [Dyadobacter fanqingshengii]
MKLSSIQLFIAILFAGFGYANESSAQEILSRPVTLQVEKADLRSVLNKLEKNAGVKFAYSPETIRSDRKVTLHTQAKPLSETLNLLLTPLNIFYEVKMGRILLTRRSNSSMVLPVVSPLIHGEVQEVNTVKGKVTDETGMGLPGVSIVIKGTREGTSTDAEGVFSIDVPDNTATLIFSFVGYQTQELAAGSNSTINVKLKADVRSLEDVMVIGYGTAKRKDLTGAVGSVSSQDLEKVIINTPEQALQGRVAGVQVRTDSHAPGGGISVQVRGTASLSASGQPLYVIDGYPISNDFARFGITDGDGGAPNPMNSIDPSNIASIEILKDASATAIYGSRATNGVVLITTKRGASGRPKIEYKTSFALEKPSKYLDFIGAKEYATLVNERNTFNNTPKTFTDAELASFGEGTNWQKEVFRTALNQRHQLSVSGGNRDIRYLISGNYADQDGIIRGTNFKRYSMNVNLDSDVTSKLTLGTNIMLTSSSENALPNDTKGYSTQPSIMSNVFFAVPHVPVRDANGDFSVFSNFKAGSGEENPVYMTERYDIRSNTSRLIGSIFANYQIIEGLDVKVRFGLDYRDWVNKRYLPIASTSARSVGGSAQILTEKTVNLLNENTLEYKKAFGPHKFSVLAGFTSQREDDQFVNALAYGFPSDFYKYNNLGLATSPQSSTSAVTKWKLLSYIGRLNYSLSNKYLLTATARYDGSSKFGASNKYGFFPSVAVAWKLSEEEFIKQLNAFSEFKLRFGYGNTGNERIGLYKSVSTVSTVKNFNTGYIFGGNLVPVAFQNNIPNPDLSWEKSMDLNLGLDLGFMQDRLRVTLDLYQKKTSQLLLDVPIPTESGFQTVLKNVGSMQNKGVELSIQSVNIKSALTWTTNANLSVNRNKILDLGGAPFLFTGWTGGASMGFNGTNVVRLAPGQPVGAIFGVIAEGIWKSKEEIAQVGTMKSALPGSMRFKDVNGDGVFDASDCVYIGNPNPDFTFGFNNELNYKQWSLSIFTYGEIGQDVMFLTKKRIAGGVALWRPDRENRWSPENPNGTTLGAAQGYPSYVSTDNVYKASFWRIKNVALSYSLPLRDWKVSKLQAVRLQLALDNPLVVTKYPGYDPEVNSYGNSNAVKGMDRFSYPALKAFRMGLNIEF